MEDIGLLKFGQVGQPVEDSTCNLALEAYNLCWGGWRMWEVESFVDHSNTAQKMAAPEQALHFGAYMSALEGLLESVVLLSLHATTWPKLEIQKTYKVTIHDKT